MIKKDLVAVFVQGIELKHLWLDRMIVDPHTLDVIAVQKRGGPGQEYGQISVADAIMMSLLSKLVEYISGNQKLQRYEVRELVYDFCSLHYEADNGYIDDEYLDGDCGSVLRTLDEIMGTSHSNNVASRYIINANEVACQILSSDSNYCVDGMEDTAYWYGYNSYDEMMEAESC